MNDVNNDREPTIKEGDWKILLDRNSTKSQDSWEQPPLMKLTCENIATLNTRNIIQTQESQACAKDTLRGSLILGTKDIESGLEGKGKLSTLSQVSELLSILKPLKQRNEQLTTEEEMLSKYTYLLEVELLDLGIPREQLRELSNAVKYSLDDRKMSMAGKSMDIKGSAAMDNIENINPGKQGYYKGTGKEWV